MSDLRYPIGEYVPESRITAERRSEWLAQIAAAPARMREAVRGLSETQLDTPYRPGGWTVRQVVHHVPDSHMNSYVRCKLALTEEAPVVKPYDEARWAELIDSREPIEVSLTLLETLHHRWVKLLGSLSEAEMRRTYFHPEAGVRTIEETLSIYAWHGRHHVAHITSLRSRMGW
jgi:hypothetical protein